MQRVLRENGLSLVVFGLFLISFLGQSLTGHRMYNDDQQQHGQKPISYTQYLSSSHYIEATFGNWESEFLQMGAFVLLTVWLHQKGSPESKPVAAPHSKTRHGCTLTNSSPASTRNACGGRALR
jgi:hypothetical protein